MTSNRQISAKVTNRALEVFKKHGGIMRTSDALASGVHAGTLYAMRDNGLLEELARGVYKLTQAPSLSSPDLVTVASKIPRAVVCLVSALSFHEITTLIPHRVEIFIPRGSRCPKLDWPPIHVHSAVPAVYETGQEVYKIDGVNVRMTNVEKTLVDCVKYRNWIGTEHLIEALRTYRSSRKPRVDLIMDYARKCRVAKIITPYMEGIL